MFDSSNDGTSPSNGGVPPRGQSHGQAALLLVESLMHGLVEKGALSQRDFIEIVEGAAEVEHELVSTNASTPADRSGSHLAPLAAAFKKELGQ